MLHCCCLLAHCAAAAPHITSGTCSWPLQCSAGCIRSRCLLYTFANNAAAIAVACCSHSTPQYTRRKGATKLHGSVDVWSKVSIQVCNTSDIYPMSARLGIESHFRTTSTAKTRPSTMASSSSSAAVGYGSRRPMIQVKHVCALLPTVPYVSLLFFCLALSVCNAQRKENVVVAKQTDITCIHATPPTDEWC